MGLSSDRSMCASEQRTNEFKAASSLNNMKINNWIIIKNYFQRKMILHEFLEIRLISLKSILK